MLEDVPLQAISMSMKQILKVIYDFGRRKVSGGTIIDVSSPLRILFLTKCVNFIFQAKSIVCTVPDARKAMAVQACIEGKPNPLSWLPTPHL